jgi:lipopolysaccharide export system permease protein
MIPELLFYTLPLSFFIGGVMTLNKLSFDSEMIVLFSLGISPSKVHKIFLKVAIFTTIFLIFNSIVMVPHTQQMYKNFIKHKKAEAALNIKATEFGQKFGNWSIFIESIDNIRGETFYNNIALVYKSGKSERFITAKKAKVSNIGGVVELKLSRGAVFSYHKEKVTKLEFEDMVINNITNFNMKRYKGTKEYFYETLKNRKSRSKFIRNSLLSLFPVLSTLFILVIGIQQLRHSRSWSNIFIGAVIGIYYFTVFTLSKKFEYYSYILVPIWFIGAYYIYSLKVLKRY